MTNVTHKFFFYVFISIYNSLHVSITQCSSSGETNCINRTSGNSHSMLVAEMCAGWKKTQCSSSGETNCINTASGNSHSMLVAEMCAGY